MSACRVSELSCKEIINISDGTRLGNITDVVFDSKTGEILSIIVPAKKEGFGFFERSLEYEIPWSDVDRIGDDYIFVRFQVPPKNMIPKRRGFF